MATVDADNTFRVFEISTGRQAIAVSFPATLQSFISGWAFSQDDLHVAVAVGRTARVFALTDSREADQFGQEVARIDHNNDVNTVAFSPDGRYLATGREPNVRVYDLTKAEQVVAFSHQGKVYATDFSPDGRFLAVGGSDNTARLFSTVSGDDLLRIDASPNNACSVDVAREGSRIGAACWDFARVVDAVTGTELTRYPLNGPLQVAISVDGRYAVAVNALHAVVFEVESGAEVGQFFIGNRGWLYSVALARQGKYFAIADASGTRVVESATGRTTRELASSTSAVYSLAFSPDGRLLATSGGEGGAAIVLDIDSGRQVAALTHGRVSSVSFDSSGTYLATGDYDQNVRVFEVTTSREIFTLPHGAQVSSVAFSADGRFLATGTRDGSTRVFEMSRGTEVARIDHDGVAETVGLGISIVNLQPQTNLTIGDRTANVELRLLHRDTGGHDALERVAKPLVFALVSHRHPPQGAPAE